MRAWTSALIPGQCCFDGAHTWSAGARVFVVQGSSWTKRYCAVCAVTRHGAPADTGQLLELSDAPRYPAPLREMAERIAPRLPGRFDAGMAAAGRDRD